jgi:hypothetical protein
MYRSGPPTYLGSPLNANEDNGNTTPMDVDNIAIEYFMPKLGRSRRISNYDAELMERQIRINGIGDVSRGVGRSADWMEATNRTKWRTQQQGRPAVRQRFVDGLGAETPVSVASNKPYMVVSDPNAPFVLYAQNAESAPFQPFALYRQYRPAQETTRRTQSRGGYPSQWNFMDGLGSTLFATPFTYPVQLPTSLVSDNTPAAAPVAASPTNRVSSSIGVRNALTTAISNRKAVIEAGYKIGTNVGLRIPVAKTRTPRMPAVTSPRPVGVPNDPLTSRSLFVEY